ncbi:pseudouridine synthase [Clostridium polyendosporum]|uniref:Pseudouridine synthase n=1 Tax=Clostridium polyendosporum TaxID=69208 RepID=A0A919S367_9CLOT|nr:pseudouridine synthase [Clostridium polyendosporum]GIM29753.1 pseudouridine synthase [Clostridium polyendosporum]
MEERLQKYMARCGVASRRKCEELIIEGKVRVNGKIIQELGTKVNAEEDIVEVSEKVIKPEERKVYIMLNKPEGYVTTVKDEKDRSTVLDLIEIKERIYPIGRLDYDSSGLLIMTNDGEVYNKIIHPRVEVTKTYIAVVSGMFSPEEMKKFMNGIDIGGYVTAKASISIMEKYRSACKVEIKIHEGKNRQIRKMCAALKHEVISLERVGIGNITLGNLPKGKWRELNKEELDYIFSL